MCLRMNVSLQPYPENETDMRSRSHVNADCLITPKKKKDCTCMTPLQVFISINLLDNNLRYFREKKKEKKSSFRLYTFIQMRNKRRFLVTCMLVSTADERP